jgi:hypothetical protein
VRDITALSCRDMLRDASRAISAIERRGRGARSGVSS